jgi:hypothetical protein
VPKFGAHPTKRAFCRQDAGFGTQQGDHVALRYVCRAMTLRALRAFMPLPLLVRFLWFFAMFEALSILMRLAST